MTTAASAPTDPNAGPAGPPPPRRLLRRTDDKMVAGVASGLADHFAVDVTLVRLAIVLLTLAGPGLLAYLVAWALVPVAPAGTPANRERAGPSLSGGQAVVGAVLLAIGAVALLDNWWWDSSFLFPLALLGVGAVLLLRQRPDAAAPAAAPGAGGAGGPHAPPPATGPGAPGPDGSSDDGPQGGPDGGPGDVDPTPGAPAGPGASTALVPSGGPLQRWAESGRPAPSVERGPLDDLIEIERGRAGDDPNAADHPSAVDDPTLVGPAAPPPPGGGGGAPGPAAWPPPPAPPPARRRARVGPVVLGTALVASGLAWWLAAADVIEPDLGDVLAGTLVLLGVGLVVGAWWGRARWLALLGVPVAVALGAVAVVGDGSLAGPWGDRSFHPATAAEVRDEYRLGVGELELDLSDVALARGEVLEVVASVGAGALTVIVPEDVAVGVDAQLRLGEVRFLDDEAVTGWDLDERWSEPGAGAGAPRLELDIDAVLGEVVVERG